MADWQPPEEAFAGIEDWQPPEEAFAVTTTPQKATRGFWGGVAEGATDPLLKLAQLGIAAREKLGFPTDVSSEQAQRSLQSRQRNIEASRGEAAGSMDWPRALGNMAATAPLAAVAPGGPAVSALLSGAASGALQPVPEGDLLTETAKGAGLGAASGLAGAGAIGAAGRLISPVASRGPAAQLVKEGITPTPGQLFGGAARVTEEKLTSIPLLGDMIRSGQRRAVKDLNVAAYNRALEPIGEKASGTIGREGVEEVKNALGAAYNKLLPDLQFRADGQFLGELGNIRQMAQELPDPQLKRFETILQDKLYKRMPTGTMDGQTLKGVESELSRLIKGYSGDASFDNRQMADALKDVLTSVRDGLVRANPEKASELKAINQGYANYARIRDAASRQGSAEGVFTPAQLSAAVRAGDRSAGHGQFATGQALMQDLSDPAKSVLGSAYPDSGTAGRALLGLAATGGLGYVNPLAAAGVGVGLLPYTGVGQRAMAGLLARRPALAEPLGRSLGILSPIGSPAGAAIEARQR